MLPAERVVLCAHFLGTLLRFLGLHVGFTDELELFSAELLLLLDEGGLRFNFGAKFEDEVGGGLDGSRFGDIGTGGKRV